MQLYEQFICPEGLNNRNDFYGFIVIFRNIDSVYLDDTEITTDNL
jgi:hypothetical protein